MIAGLRIIAGPASTLSEDAAFELRDGWDSDADCPVKLFWEFPDGEFDSDSSSLITLRFDAVLRLAQGERLRLLGHNDLLVDTGSTRCEATWWSADFRAEGSV